MFARVDRQYKYTDGTQLMGYVDASYDKLVETFGEPNVYESGESDGKTQANWALLFSGEVVATIYDWKKYGQPVQSITKWNVGGNSLLAVQLVQQALLGVKV